MEAVNTLTARLQAAGLLTAVAGLAAFGTLAVCAWAITLLAEVIRRRKAPPAAALLLALLPLAGGCIKPQAAGKDRLAAKLAADVRSEEDFLRWSDERQGQIFTRCQVQAIGPEACARRLKGFQDTVSHMRALLADRTVTLDMAVRLLGDRPDSIPTVGGVQ